MSLKDCITAAVRQGHITLEEGQTLAKRYDNIAKQVLSTGEAKAQFVAELEIEAAERKRRAFLMEGVRGKLLAELKGYRNLKGEEDIAEAFLMMHENYGRMGSYIADAEGARTVIQRRAHEQLSDLLREFRKGAITGDLRRSRPKVHARLQNVVRELFGESTGDAPAAMMAKAWEKVSEDLRVRFNEAGGAIQKLEKWGLPQGHDQQALLDYGKEKWVDRLMQEGVLDRDKTVHPLTKRRMTDEELRESLNVIWDRITTDGWIDREASGVPTGKGALWSQHADHRFLHFKSADAWMDYAKAFGNPDPYGAMMGHINKMARDIAHMEKFGPNPTVIRTYLKQHLQAEAAKVKSTEVVIGEQIEQLKDLSGKLTKPNPEREKITTEIASVLKDLDAERRTKWGKRHSRYMREERDPLSTAKVAEVELRMDTLYQKMTTLTDKLKGTPATIRDAEIAHAIDLLTEEMRDPIQFANTKNPQDHLTRTLYKADARWELMRGSMSPVSASFANVMASTRNLISAASLGSAWASSLADPMFGQDMRLRMGMGFAKANFGRVLTVALKEMVTMGSREDAVRAGLGLDSAIDVMHRTAKENNSMDARAWTGYLADRTLTYGMLSPWTQAGKHLAGLDLMAWFADNTKNDWAHIPDGLRKGLVSHGFDAASWDLIRNVPLHEPKRGVFYLRAPDIEGAAGRELSERYAAMILRETRYAVPEATVASRAVGGATRPGTFHGEVWRSMMQFKGFGIAVVMLHANRMARELMAGDRSAASMAGAMLITGAFLGAVSMSLKDIKDGRDPRKWLDEKTYFDPMFWAAAALQSGGLGIYGDFLFSNTGRTGSGLGKTMVGPVVDRIDNVLGLTMGNVGQAIRGEKTNRGREAAKLVRQNTPVIGNNIFLGLAYQRVLMDQLQRLADPEAHADFRRQIQHRRKDFKQDFWWEPGSSSPRRAPDLTRPLATR
jgi:hypothetical protein